MSVIWRKPVLTYAVSVVVSLTVSVNLVNHSGISIITVSISVASSAVSRPIGRFFRLIGRAIFGGRGLRFFGQFRNLPRVLGYRGFGREPMVS